MLPDLVGAHPVLQRLKRSLPALAALNTPLVLVGEEGVGKFLFAAHVHHHSRLSTSPLLSINATTLDERDQRIALFGGEPRMLSTTRRGLLENHSTVVLKHVDHLRPHLQNELALALTSLTIRRPGSEKERPILCRPVVTIRESPLMLHKKGRLTELLHRILLSFQRLIIPPLRKRPGDIPLLTRHFMRAVVVQRPQPSNLMRGYINGKRLDPKLLFLLKRHPWKGNVMELKTFVRSLAVLPYEELAHEVEMQEVNAMIAQVEEGREFSLKESMERVERAVISRAVQACGGNIRRAGQLLGITESAMHRRKSLLVLVFTLFSTDSFVAYLAQSFFSLH